MFDICPPTRVIWVVSEWPLTEDINIKDELKLDVLENVIDVDEENVANISDHLYSNIDPIKDHSGMLLEQNYRSSYMVGCSMTSNVPRNTSWGMFEKTLTHKIKQKKISENSALRKLLKSKHFFTKIEFSIFNIVRTEFGGARF